MVSYHTFHHSPTLPRRVEHGFAEVVLQHKGPQSPVEQAAKARTAADLSAYSSGTMWYLCSRGLLSNTSGGFVHICALKSLNTAEQMLPSEHDSAQLHKFLHKFGFRLSVSCRIVDPIDPVASLICESSTSLPPCRRNILSNLSS